MKKRIMLALALMSIIAIAWFAGLRNYFTLERLQFEGAYLQAMVEQNYVT